MLLPPEAFDHSVERISDKDKSELLRTGKCKSWTLEDQNDSYLKIKNKHNHRNLLYIRKYINRVGGDLTIVQTSNEESIIIEYWSRSAGSDTLKKTDMVPKIHANTFLDRNYLPSGYSIEPTLNLNEDGTISAYLNTDTLAEFESRKIAYTITFVWNGQKFIMQKKRSE